MDVLCDRTVQSWMLMPEVPFSLMRVCMVMLDIPGRDGM